MHHAKMPCLNKDERNRAETMLLAGSTQQEVATGIGVHQSTVQRSKGRLHQFGNTDPDLDTPGSPFPGRTAKFALSTCVTASNLLWKQSPRLLGEETSTFT